MLLGLDVAVLLASVTTILTLNGCYLHSYTATLYFAHPFFTIYYTLQIFSHYVIVWVCYDRFLAVWYFHRFLQTQQPRIIWLRMIFTGLFCVAIHLRHLLDVEVVCVSDAGVVEATNYTGNCEGGSWVILSSKHRTKTVDVWRYVWLAARGVLGMVLPMVLVVIFNSGIVVGIVRRRLHNIAATTRTRDQAYSTIYITLGFSISFVIAVMTSTVYLSLYSKNMKHCHGSFSEEAFRGASHFLLRLDHIIHIVFLAINQTFREELRTLLQATKNYICNVITLLTQTICPSHQPRSSTHSEETVSDGPQVPDVVVSAPQEQLNIETNSQSSKYGAVTSLNLQLAAQSVEMGSELSLLE